MVSTQYIVWHVVSGEYSSSSLSFSIFCGSGTVPDAMNNIEPLAKRHRRFQQTAALGSFPYSLAFLQGLWAGPLLEGIFKSLLLDLSTFDRQTCHLSGKALSGLRPLQAHLLVSYLISFISLSMV